MDGLPVLKEGDNRGFVDDEGRKVNRHGWLVDGKGNVVDIYGRKRFDRK